MATRYGTVGLDPLTLTDRVTAIWLDQVSCEIRWPAPVSLRLMRSGRLLYLAAVQQSLVDRFDVKERPQLQGPLSHASETTA